MKEIIDAIIDHSKRLGAAHKLDRIALRKNLYDEFSKEISEMLIIDEDFKDTITYEISTYRGVRITYFVYDPDPKGKEFTGILVEYKNETI